MIKFSSWLGLVLILSVGVLPSMAQATCPPSILLSFGRSASACFRLARGEACYGNGVSQATFLTEDTQSYTQPADVISLTNVGSIRTSAMDEDVSIATLLTQANQPDTEESSTVFLLFGDATLENLVPFTPTAVVKAIGSAKVRTLPQQDSEILLEVAVNDTLIAHGQNTDGTWYRVQIPNTTNIGWVSRDVVTSTDNLTLLNRNAEAQPFQNSFQVAQFSNGDASLCDGQLVSGMFIQALAENPTLITLNGAEFEIIGSLFVTSRGEQFTVYALAGEVTINESFIPAGAKGVFEFVGGGIGENMSIEPYTTAEVSSLPTTIVPYRLNVAQPNTLDGIAQLTFENSIVPTPTFVPITVTPDATVCRYLVPRDATLWAGPAEFYEPIGEIQANTVITPVLTTIDALSNDWLQIRNGAWVKKRDVFISGVCDELPFTDNIPAPLNNRYVMETCRSTNGPLREGQTVIIEFNPPAFDSFAAAIQAPRIDPGRILINSQSFTTFSSQPIVFGTATGNKYGVRVSTTWRATPGTFRIEADRVQYELTCQVTVPVGNR
jgi:hypothetical protein